MRIFPYMLCFLIISSCIAQKRVSIDHSEVDKIDVFQGYPGTKIEMINDFEKEFINDLNESKSVGPTKYMKTHRFLIHYKTGKIDTIYSNGTIHQFDGWFKSKVNLLEKYSNNLPINQTDSISEQLKIAGRLKDLMSSKKYDEAIQLFSKEQQENIKKLKQNEEMFEYWCMAWTFDKIKYERYVTKIKDGKAHFIFEDNEWKINEK